MSGKQGPEAPARWRWEPAGMRAPAARRVLYRGPTHLATAWQNENLTWSWRLAGSRGWRSTALDQDTACRATRKAVRDEEDGAQS